MTPESPNDMKMEPTRSSWLDRLAESDAIDVPVTSITLTKKPTDLDRLPNQQETRSVQESNVSSEPTKSISPRWLKIFLVSISLIAAFESLLLIYCWFSSRSSPAITRLADSASVGSVALDTSTNRFRGKDMNANRPELFVSSAGDTAYTTIASAIEAAKEGALILVKPGIYCENILLDKSLTIQGIGKREDIRVESSTGTVMAMEAPQVVVRGLTIARLMGAGERALQAVEIRSGQTTLDDCDVASATGDGIEVIGVDASFRLTRCRLHDTVKSGVWLKVGASCEVGDCDFEKIGESCIVAQKNSQSLVQKSRFSDSRNGVFVNHAQSHLFECSFSRFSQSAVQVAEKAKVSLDTCEISKCAQAAVMAEDEAVLSLAGCKILDSKIFAITANTRSQLQVSDTDIVRAEIAIASFDADMICCRLHVQECSNKGLSVLKQSNIVLRDSEFRDCLTAIALTNDSALTALQSRFLDSKGVGIGLSENASLSMAQSEVRSCTDACIACYEKSSLSLTSCKIHGSMKRGVFGDDDSRSRLIDCEVFDNGEEQIFLKKRHRSSIEGGKLHSKSKMGAIAADSSLLSIRDCQIESCGQLGVRILSDQTAQLTNIEFKRNGVSVYVDKTGKCEIVASKSIEPIHHDWHIVRGGELIGKNNSPDLSGAHVNNGGN